MAALMRSGARSFRRCGVVIPDRVEVPADSPRRAEPLLPGRPPLFRPVRRPCLPQPPRSLWWSASAACALLAAAGWLQTPAVPYLVVCVAATVAAAWIGRRQRALGPVAAVLALVTFCALATVGQVALDRVVRSWDVTAAAITRHSAAVMHDELTALASDLRNNATNALDAPTDPARAFAWLAPLARGDGERSVVLSRDGHPVAWSGTLRTVPDTSGAPFAVVRTPFYVALQATVRRGTARAVAVALLHAEPPADRLSRPLDETVAERTGVDGFALMPPSAGAPPIGDNAPAAFEPAGVPLATVRPIPPQLEEAAERVTERAQANGALAFAVALVGFLVAEWRPRRAAPVRRLLALAVPLAALAIVPLNAFSNTSRLVDPTYFFSPVGGPYTASVGALGATSAIALLAAFAAARARARLRPRWLAAAIALVASIGAPFAVAYVAAASHPPARRCRSRSGSAGGSRSHWVRPRFSSARRSRREAHSRNIRFSADRSHHRRRCGRGPRADPVGGTGRMAPVVRAAVVRGRRGGCLRARLALEGVPLRARCGAGVRGRRVGDDSAETHCARRARPRWTRGPRSQCGGVTRSLRDRARLGAPSREPRRPSALLRASRSRGR